MSISTPRVKPVPGGPVRVATAVLPAAVLALVLAVPVAQRAGAVTTESESADVVIEWNGHAQTAIIGTAGQGPSVAYLHLAMVQGAVYDAVNAIEIKRGYGYEPYLGAPAMADPEDSTSAAVATAAHDVLVALFPSQEATLDTKLATSLAAIPDGPAEAGGMEVGAAAAATMLAERANDGRFSSFTVIQGDEPGEWRSTSFTSTGAPVVEPAPWVGNVTPFLIPSAAALRSDGPNALTSAAYAADFNEVKLLGAVDSPVRTDDQTEAAFFWQANGGGLFNAIFRQLAGTQDLDIAEAARMFAMGNMAGADGSITCWNDKYYWNFWRPLSAIRLADTDGNPATIADPGWTPLFSTAPPLVTPPFPEHPSGHTCISGAVVETLKDFFGTDKVSFSTFSAISGTTREFDRFSHAIKEIIDARVWAGIHFRTADVQGHVIGRKVAHYLRKHYFQPTAPPPGAAPPPCKGLPANIVGTDGSDVLSGTPSRDVIAGLGGNDTLSGLAGNDLICGNSGKDTLKGGKDTVNGGKGKDTLLGQKGEDTLEGGGGKDLCKGGKGKDVATSCEVEKSV